MTLRWTCADARASVAWGVMSAPYTAWKRAEIRESWTAPADHAACFVVGATRRFGNVTVSTAKANGDETDVLRAGVDVLGDGATALSKTLAWFAHAIDHYAVAHSILRTDDDVALHVTLALPRAPLFGMVRHNAYWRPLERRLRLYSRVEGDRGPFDFAYGPMLGLSRDVADRLTRCAWAQSYARNLTHGNWSHSREDDGAIGYLLFECIGRVRGVIVPSAVALRCRSLRNASSLVHGTKASGAVCYASCAARHGGRVDCCRHFAYDHRWTSACAAQDQCAAMCRARWRPDVHVGAFDTSPTVELPRATARLRDPNATGDTLGMRASTIAKARAWHAFAQRQPPDDLVVLHDSRDVVRLPRASRDTLRMRILGLGAPLIFGAELGCFPANAHCAEFARRVNDSAPAWLVDCDYTCSTPPRYAFLNSGFVAGRAGAIARFYERVLRESADHHARHGRWPLDQAVVTRAFLATPGATLDYEGVLSLQLHRMRRRSLVLHRGVALSLLTRASPIFLHCNGGAKFMWKRLRAHAYPSKGAPGQDQVRTRASRGHGADPRG